jgi:hypothetical protein
VAKAGYKLYQPNLKRTFVFHHSQDGDRPGGSKTLFIQQQMAAASKYKGTRHMEFKCRQTQDD